MGGIIAEIVLGILFNEFSENLPILSKLQNNEEFHVITYLSIFFLMLDAGLKLGLKEFKESSRKLLWIAFGGMIVSLAKEDNIGWHNR